MSVPRIILFPDISADILSADKRDILSSPDIRKSCPSLDTRVEEEAGRGEEVYCGSQQMHYPRLDLDARA
jgi:hypothetical protein